MDETSRRNLNTSVCVCVYLCMFIVLIFLRVTFAYIGITRKKRGEHPRHLSFVNMSANTDVIQNKVQDDSHGFPANF